MRLPGEENWFMVRQICHSDGRVIREEITEAEHLSDLEKIMNYPYYNFRPRFWRDIFGGEPYSEFQWWRLKITYQVWRGTRRWILLWGDNTKPPIFWTLIGLEQDRPGDPVTLMKG